ncbi:MAG: 4Fe-4S dicluster domain-containing protein, partial [Lentisphaerae bacterium]|nr:4Fe-4S dicluster domain-containing protein [Lentisphaerota bacterium]
GLCLQACDTGAIKLDRRTNNINIFFHDCRFCRHCVNVCPRQALVVRKRDGFAHFQEAMALTTKTVLDSFAPARVLHINVLLNITPLCDCWGFSSPAVVPDIGIMASHDMVALETASLDAIRYQDFIAGTLIGQRQLKRRGHLFQRIHGKDPFLQLHALAKQGVGQARHKLITVK